VIRCPGRPEFDVAFFGGIDLGRSRHDGVSSPVRMLIDRAYRAGNLVGRDLPRAEPEPGVTGRHAMQMLRTYPARLRRYPFAPPGDRSIARAHRKAFARARRLTYIEDHYLWAPFVAELLVDALRSNADLQVIAVVPRFPDKEGASRWPSLVGREQAITVRRKAAGERFSIYDVENGAGVPVYVHAKAVVIDDVWAMIGSDNLNRRSWTHDSELSRAVLDCAEDERGRHGPRPPGWLRPHSPEQLPRRHRLWAIPVYRFVHDPDGRALRDRVRHRP
jgi:phosphatidylserine/phosphatidylglycerophosphate/cardiolipin synthase-like enzyme